ncbi:hypothetical protein [Methylosinus sp. Ce-a6]|uniref:hypothetical protein n=1 Tax=Methylosinus sp. Ce-a6 TaxID=2172005 RepID=UPI00135B8A05|nr:hypothetical protein [Methylosinus sp. Ce-a6]
MQVKGNQLGLLQRCENIVATAIPIALHDSRRVLCVIRHVARRSFASAIRGHWAVENENHWVRDVTLAEDESRFRVNPGVMARLRSQAFDIARANGVKNIAQALWCAAIDPTVTLSYRGL